MAQANHTPDNKNNQQFPPLMHQTLDSTRYGDGIIMPTSNTACFQVFLEVLARKFARQDILLVLDGAPNHRCGDLVVPDNVTLLYLPPYSPELNPKENLWDEIREKIFKNYALKSMDAVRVKLRQAILYMERNPKLVRSITSFPYIVNSL